jgi:hypothetical protein
MLPQEQCFFSNGSISSNLDTQRLFIVSLRA